jgi:HSP20 family protein
VSVALPGISPEKVDIDIVGRSLRIQGERTADEKAESVIGEITYGRFEREFTLPEEIDAQHVQATYRYGMLELVLPLAEGAKPHRIAVKAAPEDKQLHAA